ncbi:MAG: TRAP transporter substrate-binding protein [Lachnospiraceae bacterium]|nr:TRAP transporter substrate-binding protein [Lachnospiraceae bacterium]
MKKRWLCGMLCMAMVAGSLAGCGLKAPDEPTTAAPATTAAPEGTKATEDTESGGEGAGAGAYDTANMPEVTLVYAEVNPLDSIVGQMASDFKSKVEELSDGKITIDVQASGVLGSENDVLDTMLGGGGTIDMSRISAFALTSYGGQKSMLLSLPYTFVSREHFWNFATSDLAGEFLMESQENGSGVRGLFYGEEGFRHFFTTNEIGGLEDLKGMKLRVSNDPVMNGMVEGLGASPTVVSFGELYSSLQTGVVDGAEQPIANYKSNAFQEVAPNLILDGHTLGAVQVIITDESWDKLTGDQQAILMEAGEYASAQNRANSEKKENEVLESLKAEGVNVVEVADIVPWQEATKKVIEDNTKGYEDLYQKLLDLQ